MSLLDFLFNNKCRICGRYKARTGSMCGDCLREIIKDRDRFNEELAKVKK